MLFIDHLDFPNLSPAIVIMAKADAIEPGSSKPAKSVGVCDILQLTRRDAYTVSPVINVMAITGRDTPNAQITVIQQPKHGKLWAPDGELWTSSKIGSGIGSGFYVPDPSFIGKDTFVMQVEGNGHKVKVYYFIAVTPDDGYIPGEHCKKLGTYKISQSDFDSGSQNYVAWLQSAELSSLNATASQSFSGYQNLTGSSVGQTVGEGASAQITLDADAAGKGARLDLKISWATTVSSTPSNKPPASAEKPNHRADRANLRQM